MTEKTYDKGLAGEGQALQYLGNRGMSLIHHRYRVASGEIDIIMLDGETLVFVEVKLRNTGQEGEGLMAVTAKKQRKIVKTALYYLAEHDHDGPIRFDVVEVTAEGIQHIMDAFHGKEF